MQLNVTFTPTAPVGGAVFAALKLILTDSSANVVEVTKSASQVDSQKVDNGDGSYAVPFTVSGVGVGAFTGTVQALDTNGELMGSELSISGTTTIEGGGAWFAQPTAVA